MAPLRIGQIMLTNFLIGAVIVAAGWGLLAFGRDWMNQDTRIPDTWRNAVMKHDQRGDNDAG